MQETENRSQRSYFNHPLVVESLRCLPAALEHPDPDEFGQYVISHVPQNSQKGRKRIAGYLRQRFSDGRSMNLPLAAAVAQFGDSRTSREILYFELLRVYPLFAEIATHWLAELPEEGGSRDSLKQFLAVRIPGRSTEKVAKDSLTTMTQCGKVSRPRTAWYRAIWSQPQLEVFLYVLAALYPEPAVVPVESLLSHPLRRAMLWPLACMEDLLQQAVQAGHISKIARLDQYHQFTLAGSGMERLRRLLPALAGASGQSALFDPEPEVHG
jgi:hypothetical protein